MIDCSNTINYFEERARMVKAKQGSCTANCDECPISIKNNGKNVYCMHLERKYPAEAIAIVQKWSDEHPQKTYADVFLEKFPNCDKIYGRPSLCVRVVYGNPHKCRTSCDDCWNEVMDVTE